MAPASLRAALRLVKWPDRYSRAWWCCSRSPSAGRARAAVY